jgi:hypothetical protein
LNNTIGIVVFAFGSPENIFPNRFLANAAIAQARRFGVDIFTQRDIPINDKDIKVEYIKENDFPPPTLRIARAAVRWAKKKGFKQLRVIAAKPHMWRCIRDLQYAIKEIGIQGSLGALPIHLREIPEDEWFDLKSTQKRTRSARAWWKRERIIRRMPMWLYKLVAS